MKRTKEEGFAIQYQAALQKCLARDSDDGLATADKLGCRARKLKLGALKLAQIHEQALALTLSPPNDAASTEETIRQAGAFFRQALTPIVDDDGIPPGKKTAGKKPPPPTDELAAAKQQYQQECARRKAAEAALKKSRKHYDQLLSEAQSMQEQMRHLSHQILIAQEEERKHISRELHDEISQVLTGINVQLATLEIQAVADAAEIRKKIAKTQRLVEKSVASIHRFARRLRPAMLDDLGLVPALRTLIQEIGKRNNLETYLTAVKSERVNSLGNQERTVLYRIAQEALTNIVKHAKADRVDVSLQIESDTICLSIRDDGKSFNVQRALDSKQYRRLGIIGMRERAEMVGGTFCIESAKGEGTEVRACIPIPPESGQTDRKET